MARLMVASRDIRLASMVASTESSAMAAITRADILTNTMTDFHLARTATTRTTNTTDRTAQRAAIERRATSSTAKLTTSLAPL